MGDEPCLACGFMKLPLLRSFAANFIGTVLVGMTGVLTAPIFIRHLGKEEYGLLNLLGTVTMQLVFFDLGVRQALLRFIPLYRQTPDKLSSLLSSAALLLLILSALGGLIFVLMSRPLLELLDLPIYLQEVAQIVFILYVVDAVFELVSSLFTGMLAGGERYDVINTLHFGRAIVSAILILLSFHFTSFGLWGFVVVGIGVRTLQRYLFYLFARREFGVVGLKSWSRGEVAELVKYGAWSFIITLLSRALYHSDTLFAGVFFGTASVAMYAAAQMLTEQVRLLALGAQSVLISRLASGDDSVLHPATFYLQVAAVGMVIPLAISGSDFMRLWLGPDFIAAGDILTALVLPYLFISPSLPLVASLYAQARHRVATITNLVEVMLNVPLSLFLMGEVGLVGIAYGTSLSSIFISGFLLPAIAASRSYLRLYLYQGFVRPLPFVVVQLSVLLVLRRLMPPTSWLSFSAVHLLSTLLYICFVIVMTPRGITIMVREIVKSRRIHE